jgi:uncharacterized protein YdhG (YjbR/CyaY superfamily)
MTTKAKIPVAATVDEYIKRCPPNVQAALQKVRKTIKAAAPEAEEVISYAIPGYKYHGMLIFFAAWTNHISLYPAPWEAASLKKEMSAYKGSTGTIKFPLDEPLPLSLITRMVKYRVKQNLERVDAKKLITKKPAIKLVKSKMTEEEQVTAYMKNLNHPLKAETEALRAIIKNSNKKLSERIKWNAPNYYYKQDLVTFGPYKNGKVLLVFHHPAIVKIKSDLLEGDYKDRQLIYIDSMKAIKENKKELERIMNRLVTAIDKK